MYSNFFQYNVILTHGTKSYLFKCCSFSTPTCYFIAFKVIYQIIFVIIVPYFGDLITCFLYIFLFGKVFLDIVILDW